MPDFNNKIPKTELIETAGLEVPDQVKRVSSTILDNTAKNFIIRGFALQSLQSEFFKVGTQPSDAQHTSDKVPPEMTFGLPVFTSLEFEGGQFQDLESGVIAYQPLRIDTALITVSMSKNIITTAIQGRNGTVKEYASDGDYQIDIKGVLTGSGQNEYPAIEVEALVRLLTVPEALTVTSEFLGRFGSINAFAPEGISEIVVESFDFPQSEGFHNVQLFHIKAISDTPIELTI